MTWEARLRGRNSAVVDEEGFGVLITTGPLSRSDEEHHRNVLKAAAAPDLVYLREFAIDVEAFLKADVSVPPFLLKAFSEAITKSAIAPGEPAS